MNLPKLGSGGVPHELCHIKNIKELYFVKNWELYTSNRLLELVSTPICHELINVNDFSFIRFRELLYDILVYNVEVSDSLWIVFGKLLDSIRVSDTHIQTWLSHTFIFFKYYNNNYRPIFHLEYMFLSLMMEIEDTVI
jgi:hypothetical protein